MPNAFSGYGIKVAGAVDAPSDDPSFVRASDMLRQGGGLTLEQFHELLDLLSHVTSVQFTRLMTDDRHLRKIRQYEIMAWRHPQAAAPIVAVLLAAIAFAATVALWGG